LVEVYDLDSSDPANSKLGNISTRALVGTGDNVLIGGFIISGAQTKTVVVRALGPVDRGAGRSG
jgi:type II secretory pathway component GspD/PulD (secretin)